jgi:RNA exonuclease 1
MLVDESITKLEKYLLTKEQMEKCKYPLKSIIIPTGENNSVSLIKPPTVFNSVQVCDRCNTKYQVVLPEGSQLTECKYHPGKLHTRNKGENKQKVYMCCEKLINEDHCSVGPHVFKEEDHMLLHGRIAYSCLPSRDPNVKKHYLVAIDCEMSHTTAGLELTRFTMLDSKGIILIDELILPLNPIVDLNTKFSGINSLESAKHGLDSIKNMISNFIDSETIIIGHGLENDLNAIRVK